VRRNVLVLVNDHNSSLSSLCVWRV